MTRQYGDTASRRKPPQSDRQDDRQDDRKSRCCLLCSHKFMSEWVGDRVCKRCKQTAAWASGGSSFDVVANTRRRS